MFNFSVFGVLGLRFIFGFSFLQGLVPFIPAIAAAVTGAASIFGQERANEASAEEAAKNRSFQQKASDTAHQREVADLRAAGLNPILSAKYGGASTPVGATAQQYSVMQGVGEAVNSAFSNRLVEAQTDAQRSLANSNDAEAALKRVQTLESLQRLDIKSPLSILNASLAAKLKEISQVYGSVKTSAKNLAQGVSNGVSALLKETPNLGKGVYNKTHRRKVEVYPGN